ncbi:RimK family alpha-L-glutamate ligase [Kitasatospora sp. NPDC088346]|uniref:ATP-grasp domain-containing protein n=1 Tax=Kitasatospora sp. NPDC088346 TaxID=3364073 RepID=UPI003801415E
MRVGLITPDPGHPLLAGTADLLRAAGHTVEALAPEAGPPADPAAVYLLKARTPAALALASGLEAAGVPVLNSAVATAFCQDRLLMADRARQAGLPFAPTRTATADRLPVDRPLVVKSRHSRKGDLVARVTTPAQVARLAASHPHEPLVVQDLAPGDGWDHKLWVVDGQVFAELRRSELADGPPLPHQRIARLPAGWAALARAVGEAFGLDVYGVDVLDVAGRPLIVDINAFPGIRGQAGAPRALAALAVEAGAGRRAPRRLPGAAELSPERRAAAR